jgi:hypothetical protein
MLIDSKGFTINIWNRYFRQFRDHLKNHSLTHDLNQTIEMIALAVPPGTPLKGASKQVQREFRAFIKSLGLRKVKNRWVVREIMFPKEWWKIMEEKGVRPKGMR